jgi:8-oxo-dGTP pyrophosphatase MutT (NUDIX family)
MIAFEKSVGAVVFRKEGKKILYLLLTYNKKYWNFPKGHVEKRETEEETLRREIWEETGIKGVKISEGFRRETRYFYRAKGKEREERKKEKRKTLVVKKVVFYLVETKIKKVILSHEHIDFVWMPFEKALVKATYKNAKNILKKAEKHLKKDVN